MHLSKRSLSGDADKENTPYQRICPSLDSRAVPAPVRNDFPLGGAGAPQDPPGLQRSRGQGYTEALKRVAVASTPTTNGLDIPTLALEKVSSSPLLQRRRSACPTPATTSGGGGSGGTSATAVPLGPSTGPLREQNREASEGATPHSHPRLSNRRHSCGDALRQRGENITPHRSKARALSDSSDGGYPNPAATPGQQPPSTSTLTTTTTVDEKQRPDPGKVSPDTTTPPPVTPVCPLVDLIPGPEAQWSSEQQQQQLHQRRSASARSDGTRSDQQQQPGSSPAKLGKPRPSAQPSQTPVQSPSRPHPSVGNRCDPVTTGALPRDSNNNPRRATAPATPNCPSLGHRPTPSSPSLGNTSAMVIPPNVGHPLGLETYPSPRQLLPGSKMDKPSGSSLPSGAAARPTQPGVTPPNPTQGQQTSHHPHHSQHPPSATTPLQDFSPYLSASPGAHHQRKQLALEGSPPASHRPSTSSSRHHPHPLPWNSSCSPSAEGNPCTPPQHHHQQHPRLRGDPSPPASHRCCGGNGGERTSLAPNGPAGGGATPSAARGGQPSNLQGQQQQGGGGGAGPSPSQRAPSTAATTPGKPDSKPGTPQGGPRRGSITPATAAYVARRQTFQPQKLAHVWPCTDNSPRQTAPTATPSSEVVPPRGCAGSSALGSCPGQPDPRPLSCSRPTPSPPQPQQQQQQQQQPTPTPPNYCRTPPPPPPSSAPAQVLASSSSPHVRDSAQISRSLPSSVGSPTTTSPPVSCPAAAATTAALGVPAGVGGCISSSCYLSPVATGVGATTSLPLLTTAPGSPSAAAAASGGSPLTGSTYGSPPAKIYPSPRLSLEHVPSHPPSQASLTCSSSSSRPQTMVPSQFPTLSESQWRAIRENQQWLEAQLSTLSALLPESKRPAALSLSSSPEDEKAPGVARPSPPKRGRGLGSSDEGWVADDEGEDEDGGFGLEAAEGAGCGGPVNSRFVKDVFSRFQECQQYGHLPTLNLCFSVLEMMLQVATQRNLSVVLSKANISMVLSAMQYNPKFNSKVASRPKHLANLSNRLEAVPLPGGVADLAELVYGLQYLKDVVVPVVCDDGRFQPLNQCLVTTKARLCQAVLFDRRLLPRLFTDLCEGGLSEAKKYSYLRFLRELLELGGSSGATLTTLLGGAGGSSGESGAALFWRALVVDFSLLPHLTSMLAQPCGMLRKAAVDVVQLLCDDECRKVMFPVLPQCGEFLRRLFDLYCDYPTTEEGTVLQIQHALPMLVVAPHRDVLPLFYDAAESVLARWIDSFSRSTNSTTSGALATPPAAFLASLIELLSLATHHHFRMSSFHHRGCVVKLIDLLALLWHREPRMPSTVLVAVNKGILSILHLGEPDLHHYLVHREIFRPILRHFREGNNLLTSSILTLLHTILQLKISSLISYINWLWFEHSPGQASPWLKPNSYVYSLFQAQHCATMAEGGSPILSNEMI